MRFLDNEQYSFIKEDWSGDKNREQDFNSGVWNVSL
jgi:hypothetical protein